MFCSVRRGSSGNSSTVSEDRGLQGRPDLFPSRNMLNRCPTEPIDWYDMYKRSRPPTPPHTRDVAAAAFTQTSPASRWSPFHRCFIRPVFRWKPTTNVADRNPVEKQIVERVRQATYTPGKARLLKAFALLQKWWIFFSGVNGLRYSFICCQLQQLIYRHLVLIRICKVLIRKW